MIDDEQGVPASEIEEARRSNLGMILESTPVSDAAKADLWDLYHRANSPVELADVLRGLTIPDHIKQRLVAEKAGKPVASQWTPKSAPTQLDKTLDVISQFAKLDPKLLDFAEKHSTLAKLVIEAAAKKNE